MVYLAKIFRLFLWSALAFLLYPTVAVEKPAAAESSPPGDIPDNQVFITFNSPLGFTVQVPEGWARRETDGAVSFADKYNRIEITVGHAEAAPTEMLVKKMAVEVEQVDQTFKLTRIRSTHLPAGPVVIMTFTSNSEPNPVTSKATRLEHACYFYFHAGNLARLTLSAPMGADNVDVWRLVSESFRWQ